MSRLVFPIAIYLFTFSISDAQDLPRRGSLGAALQSTENQKGLYVSRVLDGSTGAALGLKAGDVILEVDGVPYYQVPDLVRTTSAWIEGTPLKMKVIRQQNVMLLEGKVRGKPLETSDHGQVIYDQVSYRGGLLRSILEIPSQVEKPAVVMIIPGIGCNSQDFYYNSKHPIKQLVEDLVDQGFAVFRVEKPGIGDSQTPIGCEEMGFQDEIEAYSSAIEQLKTQTKIDHSNIFLFGISLGGITAPLVASNNQVKGVILWGSVSTSWYEYSLDLLRHQPVHFGEDYNVIEQNFRNHQPFIYDFLVRKLTPEQLAENPDYQTLLTTYFPYSDNRFYGLHHYRFFHELNDVDIPAAWEKTDCAVLALHGEYDLHAINTDWAEHTIEMVNYFHPGNGSWSLIPKTEHGFSKVSSMAENIRIRQNGALDPSFAAEHYNHEIAEIMGDWMKDILDS